MEAMKHQPWRISVRAKAKNFDFRFTASKILPSWSFYGTQFSLLVKLRRFFFKVRSETGDAARTRRGGSSSSLKSKFFQLLEKLRRKPKVATTNTTTIIKKHKKNPTTTTTLRSHPQIGFSRQRQKDTTSKPHQDKSKVGSGFLPNLASIYSWVLENDHTGGTNIIIISYTLKLLIYFALFLKNYIMRKIGFSIILVGFMGYLIRFFVGYNMDPVWSIVWDQFASFSRGLFRLCASC